MRGNGSGWRGVGDVGRMRRAEEGQEEEGGQAGLRLGEAEVGRGEKEPSGPA